MDILDQCTGQQTHTQTEEHPLSVENGKIDIGG